MAAKITDEEKKELIEKFVAENQCGFFLPKTAGAAFKHCSEGVFKTWIKSIYGKTSADFLTERGVIAVSKEDRNKGVEKYFSILKKAYDGKSPAKDAGQLRADNPDIPFEDIRMMILSKGIKTDFDVTRFFTEGILEDKYATADAVKAFAKATLKVKIVSPYYVFDKLTAELGLKVEGVTNYSDILGPYWINYVFDKYPEVLSMTAEEYYIKKKYLLSQEVAQAETDKCLSELAKKFLKKAPVGQRYEIYPVAQNYDVVGIIDFLTEKGLKNGLNATEAENAAWQMFVDAGVLAGEKSKNAAVVKIEKAVKETKKSGDSKKTTKFDLYSNMDKLDFSSLTDDKKYQKWPKAMKCTVSVNGVDINVNTSFRSADDKIGNICYDAYQAIDTLHCRELRPEEIRWETNGEPQYSGPEIDEDKLTTLDADEIERRMGFIRAVANLISDAETLEEIVKAAPKKKNGTLYKKKTTFIASSGLTDYAGRVYAIFGYAKSDTQLSIGFDEVGSKIGDNENWNNDIISTYHEGLAVSEAMKKIANNE
ncbi:MAG: hypothetical protein KBT46_08995 [Ruminococcus sp.]|nr:hypothetical protein [Candidatus Copronaster equi]